MYYLNKKYLKHETIWRQNVLLKQKVVLISREVIERARQRDEQTEVLTEVRTRFQGPQYVLPLTMALLTSYTVNARYAEPAFGRLTTRANMMRKQSFKCSRSSMIFLHSLQMQSQSVCYCYL